MYRLQDSISERKWTSLCISHSKHYSVCSEVIPRTNRAPLFCKHLVKEIKQREQTNRMLPKKRFFLRFAFIDPKRCQCPFLFSSSLVTLALTIIAVQPIFILNKRLMLQYCCIIGLSTLDRMKTEISCQLWSMNWSIEELNGSVLKKANILNNKLSRSMFLSNLLFFNTTKIQRLWTVSLESKKERIWSCFHFITKLPSKLTSLVVVCKEHRQSSGLSLSQSTFGQGGLAYTVFLYKNNPGD